MVKMTTPLTMNLKEKIVKLMSKNVGLSSPKNVK
jgi:hypothetical protein